MSEAGDSKVRSDREILQAAHEQGSAATLGAWVRLSGPGWLQSAITLGGGSLSGALFLGILGGTDLLWLQLMAIVMGVVMLSAISYVTLSTGERPFQQINSHINPVLGWGWIVATIAANMLWLMPQFGLCYDALNKNLLPGVVGDGIVSKSIVSAILLAVAGVLIYMNTRGGTAAKIFDWILKAMIGVVVICFFGVVVKLSTTTDFDWGAVLGGFIPNPQSWFAPAGELAAIVDSLPENVQQYWNERIVAEQRLSLIGAAATAVGINMTFLLPYSMLARGWDRPFRGLARFDLATGMAIPYVLVTSCVVIASAAAFHANVDESFLSTDNEVMQKSPVYNDGIKILRDRIVTLRDAGASSLSEDDLTQLAAQLPAEEKQLAASLVKRNNFLISETLAPLLGSQMANLVFGIGIFGMGFSTIIILTMINGYAFTEIVGAQPHRSPHVVGCVVAGLSGASWFFIWGGKTATWLAILVSSFGAMFLPIAYVTFFLMMNSKRILGKDHPQGVSWIVWNLLMIPSVLGAIAAAVVSIWDKATNPGIDPLQKYVMLSVVIGYLILVPIGFFLIPKHERISGSDTE